MTASLPGKIVIHVVLLLMIGDNPAQCGTGKFLNREKLSAGYFTSLNWESFLKP